MFKVGDKIKVNIDVFQREAEIWNNTQVYQKLMDQAKNFTFEIIGETNDVYNLKRIEDGMTFNPTKAEAKEKFVLIT